MSATTPLDPAALEPVVPAAPSARSAAPGAAPLFSPYWYKIADLKPRLRPGVTLTRREEQGEVWHILSAPESNKHLRMDAAAHAIVGALDGVHTLDEIWKDVLGRFGDSAPGQDEAIRLLGQLHQADALNAGTIPALDEAARRARRQKRQKTLQQLKNPLFFRIPMFDPERVLTASLPFVRPLFSWWGFALWLGVIAWLLVEVARHWEALFATAVDRALAVDNLAIAALVFPFAKLVHELAHGWAVKHWGGEVREVGIMFLVFLPAPYVDASAAASFPRKRARILTSAVGMMAEALLAALAMYVWVRAETGLVTALAFNTMLVAGVSTFLFNGNPLLRFDAYFMLSDAVGVQNLASRSQKWWGWLVHRYGFGIEEWPNPARTRSETRWFIFYHPASYAYRVFLTLTIALFVAGTYPVIGLTLAVWSVTTTLLLPAVTGLWAVATGPRIAKARGRALGVTAVLAALPVGVLFFLPLPHGTVVPAVVVAPDEAWVTAPAEGEITRVAVQTGERAIEGGIIAELDQPLLASEVAVLEARVRATEARLAADEADRARAGDAAVTRSELGYLQEEWRRRADDLAALTVEAARGGVFVAPDGAHLPGRRHPKGGRMGLILPPGEAAELRAVVPAAFYDLVTARPGPVSVMYPGGGFEPEEASLIRIAPEVRRDLPFSALAAPNGGPITMDPTDPDGRRAAQPFHVAEIETGRLLEALALGGIVWVRLDHGSEPLAPRIWRGVRRVFLSQLEL